MHAFANVRGTVNETTYKALMFLRGSRLNERIPNVFDNILVLAGVVINDYHKPPFHRLILSSCLSSTALIPNTGLEVRYC